MLRSMSIPVRWIVAFSIFAVVLRPYPGSIGSLAAGRVQLLVGSLVFTTPMFVFLFWLMNDYHLRSKKRLELHLPAYAKLFFWGISFWVLLVSLLAFLRGTSQVGLLNLGELLRYPVYFLIFMSGYYAALFVSRKRVMQWLSWAILTSCSISIIQLFSIPWLNDIVLFLYGHGKMRTFGSSPTNFRVFGTFRNPNWFGISLAIVFPFIWYHYRKASLWKQIFIYGFVFVACFISGSRGAWLGMVLVAFSFLSLNVFCRVGGKRVFTKYAILLVAVGVGISLFLTWGSLTYRRSESIHRFISSGGTDLMPSTEKRLAAVAYYIGLGLRNPLLGAGPSNYWIGIPDNQYVLSFVKYGVLSLVLYAILLTGMLIEAIRSKTVFGLVLAVSVLVLSYGMSTQALVDTIQVISVFLYIYGFSIAKLRIKRYGKSVPGRLLRQGRCSGLSTSWEEY